MAAMPHERLSQAMDERRLDLQMRWTDIASAAEISPEALRAIRRGQYRPSDLTARRLDAALQWAAGSTMRVLDEEGDPLPLPDGKGGPRDLTTGEMIAEAHEDMDELERLDEELARRMQIAKRSAENRRQAVAALRLVQGEVEENGRN